VGTSKPFHPHRVALRITVLYVLLGALWILLSDKMMGSLFSDKGNLAVAGMLKGWFYVFITGYLLYRLILAPLQKQKDYQEQLHHSAYQDSLTELPNRLALNEDITSELEDSPEQQAGLLFLDLDKLKLINDYLGHASGDALIQEFSSRLVQTLPETVKLYRLGGDEFVIWMIPLRNEQELERVAKEILASVKEPFLLGGSYMDTTVSIGGALYPKHGRDVDHLLRCADIAMYKAKGAGGSLYVLHEPSMNEAFIERVKMERHLRHALENKELDIHYQPQYDIGQKRIIGFEALLRWNNPQLGRVAPDRFIPVAEESHLIVPIGEWVLRTSCAFIREFRERTGETYAVSVNLSIVQIMQDQFVDMVEDAVASSGIPPCAVELELTESIFMESLCVVNKKLEYLRERGFRIALDDFGKGYSSLNCLMTLPISTIKIDKSFIDNIDNDPKYLFLIRNIVDIGHTFGLEVIAEGVENTEQTQLLAASNCRMIQGYWFSKPLPGDELIRFLEEAPPVAAEGATAD
jgi:diguanylate cyclase (GGDEF)-like protein